VVTNAVVLVDLVDQYREQGMNISQAVVSRAVCVDRGPSS